MTKKYSVMVLLKYQDSILLQDINFGSDEESFWDGFGSFYNQDELPIDTAKNVFKENFGFEVITKNFIESAKINFIIQKPAETVDLKTFVFIIELSSEQKQKVNHQCSYRWFEFNKIPYQVMHKTSARWMPITLESSKLVEFDIIVDQPDDHKKMKIIKFEYK